MITINQQIEPTIITELSKRPFRYYIDNKEIFLLLKRFFDVILSTIVIVFFVQRRVGRSLRSFGCIKFRTMIPNDKANEYVACENDNRVTTLGKFLRKTSLDELPQFLNVFIGDMSVVGPRPHMFSDCNRFSEYIQDYKVRSMMRPGITGLAQVKGFRGPAEDSHNIISRFYYDSLYIQSLIIRMEVSILFNTVWQVLPLIFFNKDFKKKKAKKIDSDSPKIAA